MKAWGLILSVVCLGLYSNNTWAGPNQKKLFWVPTPPPDNPQAQIYEYNMLAETPYRINDFLMLQIDLDADMLLITSYNRAIDSPGNSDFTASSVNPKNIKSSVVFSLSAFESLAVERLPLLENDFAQLFRPFATPEAFALHELMVVIDAAKDPETLNGRVFYRDMLPQNQNLWFYEGNGFAKNMLKPLTRFIDMNRSRLSRGIPKDFAARFDACLEPLRTGIVAPARGVDFSQL